MRLFGQLTYKLGKTILPTKQTKIMNLSVPKFMESTQFAFPAPIFAQTIIHKIEKTSLSEAQVAPNLLFSFVDVSLKSGFEPLTSSYYKLHKVLFSELAISKDLLGCSAFLKTAVDISENLFVRLGSGDVKGKRYNEQKRNHCCPR